MGVGLAVEVGVRGSGRARAVRIQRLAALQRALGKAPQAYLIRALGVAQSLPDRDAELRGAKRREASSVEMPCL